MVMQLTQVEGPSFAAAGAGSTATQCMTALTSVNTPSQNFGTYLCSVLYDVPVSSTLYIFSNGALMVMTSGGNSSQANGSRLTPPHMVNRGPILHCGIFRKFRHSLEALMKHFPNTDALNVDLLHILLRIALKI